MGCGNSKVEVIEKFEKTKKPIELKKQNKCISYHCKICGEIPLLHFSLFYLDVVCSNHKVLNIPFDKFEHFIKFDNECSVCSKKCNDNNLNYCYECKIFFCNNCKNKHKSHSIVNANEKNTICNLHHKKYDKFCFNCKINLCELCDHKNNNKNHYIELIKDIYPSDNDINIFNEISFKKMNLLNKKENEIKEQEKRRDELKFAKISKDEGNKEDDNEKENENEDEDEDDDDENEHESEFEEMNFNRFNYLDRYKIQYESINQQKNGIKIKKLLMETFSKNISNYIYINNINNIIRCSFIRDIPQNYRKLNIKYFNDYIIKDDINHIKNKIVFKTFENDIYGQIWCMKKLNEIKKNENQKLSLIALGNSNSKIVIINLLNFRIHQIIEEHEDTVYSLEQYKEDSKYLFSSSEDDTINIYELGENYKYYLIQKLKKEQEKSGSEINKVIALSNKLLVSSDHRSITIWKSNNNEKNKLHYEDYYEIVINKDTCHLLEVNPSLFVATQYQTDTFQVYKNEGKTFPLIGQLENVGTHGHSSNGLAKINDRFVCSATYGEFYVICIEPLQIIQRILNFFDNITYLYITKQKYLYCKNKDDNFIQYKIVCDEEDNFVELDELGSFYLKEGFQINEKSILPLDDGRIFLKANNNNSNCFYLIA